ncbi:MAG: ferritin-like domain-containing protein [Myxococcota bacterium]
MKQTATIGRNRTGVSSSDGRSDAMQKDSTQFEPSSHGTAAGPDKVRVAYTKEGHAHGSALGSVPPPKGIRAKAEAAVGALKSEEPTLLMDRMGDRLAFERTGTRLYEALVSKHEAFGTFEGGPSRRDLVEIMEQEHGHFIMLENAMKEMGGDPTAMTPSADIAATATAGVMKVIVDPRTTLLQGLDAILIAELADNASWEELVQLAERANETELVEMGKLAQRTEEEHLTKVKAWIAAGQGRANGELAP